MAVKAAWEVRSDARAHLVSREQFDGFHELLREAEEHLDLLISNRDPGTAQARIVRLGMKRPKDKKD